MGLNERVWEEEPMVKRGLLNRDFPGAPRGMGPWVRGNRSAKTMNING